MAKMTPEEEFIDRDFDRVLEVIDKVFPSEKKTLGQLAYEAAAGHNGDIRSWDDVDKETWEVAAQAVATAIQSPK